MTHIPGVRPTSEARALADAEAAEALARLVTPGSPENAAAGVVRPPQSTYPRNAEPGIHFDGTTGRTVINTPWLPTEVDTKSQTAMRDLLVDRLNLPAELVPPGATLRVRRAKFDPAAWHRDAQGEDAVTRSIWRYEVEIEDTPHNLALADLEGMIREARAKGPLRAATAEPSDVHRTLVVGYADPQWGKVGSGGGSAELAARIAEKIGKIQDHVRDLRLVGRPVDSSALLDAGDDVENIENTVEQAFTNDLLPLTQFRAHRRTLQEMLEVLARTTPQVLAAVVPSNHGQMRRGGKAIGPPGHDWGIEAMATISDAFKANPDRYGHVKFAFPESPFEDTLSLDIAGTLVGLSHSHQAGKPEKIADYWRGQNFGDRPLRDTRILVTGHFHTPILRTHGDGKTHIGLTTIDNGSDWYANLRGEQSRPGLVVFSVTKDGWDDYRIL